MKTGKKILTDEIVKLCPGFFHVEKSKDLLIFLQCVFLHNTFSIWEAFCLKILKDTLFLHGRSAKIHSSNVCCS